MIYDKKNLLVDEFVDEWLENTELAEKTAKNYKYAVKIYCELHKMTPTELIEEAEGDLQSNKLPRQYGIKKRLVQYQKFLTESRSQSTKAIYTSGVKSFYHYFEIPLPLAKRRNKIQTLIKNDWKGFGKDVVRNCLKHLNSRNRAMLLSIVSGGFAKNEILNLKISDTQNIDAQGITTVRLIREKTNTKYTTFLSMEATQAIREYLKDRKERTERLGITDDVPYLFVSVYKGEVKQLDGFAYNMTFIDLAKKMGKEFETDKGTFNALRGHNFRKFFKTQMQNHGLPVWQVESQMGHELSPLDKAYFIEDEHKMKENYVKHLEAVMVETEVKEVSIEESEKFQKMQAEMSELEDQNKALLEKMISLEMVQTVIQDNLDMKAQLESQTMLHPEEFTAEPIRPDTIATMTKGVDEIKDSVKNFDLNREKAEKEYRASLKEAENNKNAS